MTPKRCLDCRPWNLENIAPYHKRKLKLQPKLKPITHHLNIEILISYLRIQYNHVSL